MTPPYPNFSVNKFCPRRKFFFRADCDEDCATAQYDEGAGDKISDEHSINAVIEQIYAAALDLEKWQQVVDSLQAIAPFSAIGLYGSDSKTNIWLGGVHQGFDPHFMDIYPRDYAAINPFLNGFLTAPLCTPLAAEQVCPTPELRKSVYFNEWLAPQKLGGGAGSVLLRDESRIFVLTFNSDLDRQEAYERILLEVTEVVSPHLRRSFALSRKVAAQRFVGSDYRPALDLIPGAVYLLNRNGQLIQLNQRAEALLAARHAVGVERGGRLFLRNAEADRVIARNLHGIAAGAHGGTLDTAFFHTPSGLCQACIAPFVTGKELDMGPLRTLLPDRPIAVLILTTPGETPYRDFSHIARLFKLTPAEAKLAAALACGETLTEFSDRHRVSVHTVRTQLKSIFSKTGTSRQSELVSLLLQFQAS